MNRLLGAVLAAVMLVGNGMPMEMPGVSSDPEVIWLNEEKLELSGDEFSLQGENYMDFLADGGIIVVSEGKQVNCSFEEALNVPFSVKENEIQANVEEIATLYYNYAGAIGVRSIKVEAVNESEYQSIIMEELDTLKEKLADQPMMMMSRSMYTTDYIGEYTETYTYKPKLKIEVDYDFYTLQDYVDGKDYYSVVGNIYGNSGRAMTDLGYSGYQSKYETDSLSVTFESKTSGFTREEFGPGRTEGESSYSFDVGADFGSEVSVSAGLSGSYTIPECDINVSSASTKTVWTVEYDDEGQLQTSEFHPAITMSCPSSTGSAKLYVSTAYQVDSWNTSPEKRVLSKTITCYPDRVSY